MKIIEVEYANTKLKIAADFRRGKEDSLVFIHGLGCSKDAFLHAFNFSFFNDFSILTFDLVGFGDSTKAEEFSYSIEDHAEVCKLVIDKLSLNNIHIVGHSMGGAVALLLIEKLRQRVKSFISLEGNLVGEDCYISRKAAEVSFDEFKSIFEKIKENNKNSPWYNMLCKTMPLAFYKSSCSLVEYSDSNELLRKFLELKIKKAYIFGEKNAKMPVLEKIEDKVKVFSISKSGHFMMLDNPEEFYRKLFEIIVLN